MIDADVLDVLQTLHSLDGETNVEKIEKSMQHLFESGSPSKVCISGYGCLLSVDEMSEEPQAEMVGPGQISLAKGGLHAAAAGRAKSRY